MFTFKRKQDVSENQVTDESVYRGRRQLLKQLGFVGSTGLLAPYATAGVLDWFSDNQTIALKPLSYVPDANPSEPNLTPESKVTSYNNFYEFGTQKDQPAENAKDFNPDPWTLQVSGMVNKPITLGYEDLIKRRDLQESIYRLRCVEAWSMVIPWIGFPLASLIKQADPQGSAKYVAFESLADKSRMPGVGNYFLGGGIDYPYVEGLRMDEAMHPLTILAVGLYGKTLPGQNGAPVRLVVPWKYGFKSIKSIVSIRLTDKQPPTTWNKLAPQEYGFYANVNPAVDHPRWSQARERRILSGGLFNQTYIDTQPFNGYAEQVASLYQGMDLRRNY